VKCEVVRIGKVFPHPHADTLGITYLAADRPVIVKQGSLADGDLATYIPVDTMVPTYHSAFAFLGDRRYERVGVKRIRGKLSYGLLVRAPTGALPGDDASVYFGVREYQHEQHPQPTPFERAMHKAGLVVSLVQLGLFFGFICDSWSDMATWYLTVANVAIFYIASAVLRRKYDE